MSGRTLDGLLSLEDVAAEAQIGDPDEEGLTELRGLGRDLTNYLFQSLRILAIHDANNAAVEEPLRRLDATLTRLFGLTQTVHFITVEGQVYLNDLRVKMEATAYGNVTYLLGQLGRHGIGGITFSAPPPAADLKTLMVLLLETKPAGEEDSDKLSHIRVALDAADLPHVEFDQPYYFKAGDSAGASETGGRGEESQEHAALSYAKGVLAVKDYFRAVEAAETANPLRIRKIVHDLVDVAEDDPDDFLKLHVIQGVEDPYYNHCVNVATLTVAIGRVLGLTRVELADLGAAAMFHDLGYAALERQEEVEQREFSDQDRMRLHPVAGFRSLLRQGEYGPGLLRRLQVTLEHHMHWTRPGGYPNLGRKSISVFTRIVQVADHYDALVTATGNEPGMLPVKALERIVAASGTQFDPVAVKALVQVVGRYPYGSLVRLSTGEIGVVSSGGGRHEEAFMRPIVMIVRSGDGSEVTPHAVDLAVPGILKRRVAEVLDPQAADVTPHAVLFDRLRDGENEETDEAAAKAAEAKASIDSAAWNQAVWDGEDAETLVTEALADVEPGVDDEPLPARPAPPGPTYEDDEDEDDDLTPTDVPNLSRLAVAASPARPSLEGDPASLSGFFPVLDELGEDLPSDVPLLSPRAGSALPSEVRDAFDALGDDDDEAFAHAVTSTVSQHDVLAWLDAALDATDPSEGEPPTLYVEPTVPDVDERLGPVPTAESELPPLLPHDDDVLSAEDLAWLEAGDVPPPPPEPVVAPAPSVPAAGLSTDDMDWLAGMEAPAPPPPTPQLAPARDPAEVGRLMKKAFAEGGEAAVQALMAELEAEGRS